MYGCCCHSHRLRAGDLPYAQEVCDLPFAEEAKHWRRTCVRQRVAALVPVRVHAPPTIVRLPRRVHRLEQHVGPRHVVPHDEVDVTRAGLLQGICHAPAAVHAVRVLAARGRHQRVLLFFRAAETDVPKDLAVVCPPIGLRLRVQSDKTRKVDAARRVGRNRPVCGDMPADAVQADWDEGMGGWAFNFGAGGGDDTALWLAPPPPTERAQLTGPPKSYRD